MDAGGRATHGAVAEEARAESSLIFRLGFLNANFVAGHICAVEIFNGGFCLTLFGHLHKSKTLGEFGAFVDDECAGLH